MCFRASVLLRKASALKRIDVRYGPQNAVSLYPAWNSGVEPLEIIVEDLIYRNSFTLSFINS